MLGLATFLTTEEKYGRHGLERYIICGPNQTLGHACIQPATVRTLMTFRRPSSMSLSLRLSSSFLTWRKGRSRGGLGFRLRAAPADCAASSVRSLAACGVSGCIFVRLCSIYLFLASTRSVILTPLCKCIRLSLSSWAKCLILSHRYLRTEVLVASLMVEATPACSFFLDAQCPAVYSGS